MKKILNYKCSSHFEEQIRKRRIDPFLISLCLVKGDIVKEQKKKNKFILTKGQIEKAIMQGYINATDCKGLKSLVVITRSNILITAFGRYGDTGISNLLSL
ncbi:MAG: hypothetical protein GXO79_00080 [Chlorobi bacterium]|nr:hypothetical protein [Chlorobiota bacterium]